MVQRRLLTFTGTLFLLFASSSCEYDDYFNPSTVIWPESQTIEFDFSLSPGESEKVSMDMKLRRSAKESTNLYFFYIDGHWYLTGLRTNLSTNDQLTSRTIDGKEIGIVEVENIDELENGSNSFSATFQVNRRLHMIRDLPMVMDGDYCFLLSFERDNFQLFSPWINASNKLTINQLTINVLNPLEIVIDKIFIISNTFVDTVLGDTHLKKTYHFKQSKTPMMAHEIAFAVLSEESTFNFKCKGFKISEQSDSKSRIHFYIAGPQILRVYEKIQKDVLCDVIEKMARFCFDKLGGKRSAIALNILILEDFEDQVSYRPGFVIIRAQEDFAKLLDIVSYAIVREWTHGMTSLYDFYDVWFEFSLTHFLKIEGLRSVAETTSDTSLINLNNLYQLSIEPGSYSAPLFKEKYDQYGYPAAEKFPELLIHGAIMLADLNTGVNGRLMECVKLLPSVDTELQSRRTWRSLEHKDDYFVLLANCDSLQFERESEYKNLPVDVSRFVINYLLGWFDLQFLPVLTIHIQGRARSIKYFSPHSNGRLSLKKDFLCHRQYPSTECREPPAKDNSRFYGSFSLQALNGSLLWHSMFFENDDHKGGFYWQTAYASEDESALFVVNGNHFSNFLVRYPNHFYVNFLIHVDEAFHEINSAEPWHRQELRVQYSLEKPTFIFFLLDLFELSRRAMLDERIFIAFWQRAARFSRLGLYSLPAMQRVNYFQLLCLGSDLDSKEFHQLLCDYAAPPPEKYRDPDSSRSKSTCSYPIPPDVVTKYDNEHPPNWRLDCQFWKEKYWLPSLSKIDLKKLPNVDDLDVKDFETSPY